MSYPHNCCLESFLTRQDLHCMLARCARKHGTVLDYEHSADLTERSLLIIFNQFVIIVAHIH